MPPDTTELTLPSGRVVHVRQPDLPQLIFDDEIPDVLSGMIEKLILDTMKRKGISTADENQRADELGKDFDDGERVLLLLRFFARQAVVEPVIVETLDDGKRLRSEGRDVLHISHLDYADQFAIYYASLGVSADFQALFRRAQATDQPVAPVPDGDHDGTDAGGAAERAAEPAVDALHGQPGGEPVGPMGRAKGKRARTGRVRKEAGLDTGVE